MTGFEDALDYERRNAQWNDRREAAEQQRRQRHEQELAEEITEVLTEAAAQFRRLPAGLALQLVRPRRRFERADREVTDAVGARYVLIDEQRCWAVPPHGGRGKVGDLVFTEHGGMVAVPGPGLGYRVLTPDPLALAVNAVPPAVDVATEFAPTNYPGFGRPDFDPRPGTVKSLRAGLAQSLVAYERTLAAGEPISGLFRHHPIEWRRG